MSVCLKNGSLQVDRCTWDTTSCATCLVNSGKNVTSGRWEQRLLLDPHPVQPGVQGKAGAIIGHHVMIVNVSEGMIDMHLDTSELFYLKLLITS